jgi:hypothetical protein
MVLAFGPVGPLPADDPKPTLKPGVVLDRRGPPDLRNALVDGRAPTFTITYTITVDGLKEPRRHPVNSAGYDPTLVEGAIVGWQNSGYVVEKAGETQVRFVGWKDKRTGKVYPVTGIKIESEDLRPDQLPKVVPDPKQKG